MGMNTTKTLGGYMKKLVLVIAMVLVSANAFAGEVSCWFNNGGNIEELSIAEPVANVFRIQNGDLAIRIIARDTSYEISNPYSDTFSEAGSITGNLREVGDRLASYSPNRSFGCMKK